MLEDVPLQALAIAAIAPRVNANAKSARTGCLRLRQDHASGGGGLIVRSGTLDGSSRGLTMRWTTSERKAADEYGTQQNALAWAEDRPVLAVCLVLVAWVVVVFAIASVYAFLV